MQLAFRCGKASHCHNAPDTNSRQRGKPLRLRKKLGRIESALGFLSREPELSERFHSPTACQSVLGHRSREPFTVERMQQHEMIERLHLVPLQVPDEMPAHRNVHRGHFLERFLNLVLTDIAQPALVRGARGVGTVRLRDRHDRHLLAVPSALARRLDALPYLGHALGQAGKSHSRKI
jgi:hypothetical protein